VWCRVHALRHVLPHGSYFYVTLTCFDPSWSRFYLWPSLFMHIFCLWLHCQLPDFKRGDGGGRWRWREREKKESSSFVSGLVIGYPLTSVSIVLDQVTTPLLSWNRRGAQNYYWNSDCDWGLWGQDGITINRCHLALQQRLLVLLFFLLKRNFLVSHLVLNR
jgi:hypothetical protein